MTALLLDPHGDDAALFAYFTLLSERPHVCVVLRSFLQQARGIPVTAEQREAEAKEFFFSSTPCTWEQWPYPDADPDWGKIEQRIWALADFYDVCYYPEPEEGGHDHHNRIGGFAQEAFGQRSTGYLTYTTEGKSTWGRRVVPNEPLWVGSKLVGLSYFVSQIEHPATGTAAHFLRGLDEYVA